MREKTLKDLKKNEKFKFLLVVLFFLLSGILYSHSFHSGTLEMGKRITAEEIGIPEGDPIAAESLLDKIDINRASAAELCMLPGIGESRAAEIIRYREENGEFHQIEDILLVSGIGEKTFEEIKESITVGE